MFDATSKLKIKRTPTSFGSKQRDSQYIPIHNSARSLPSFSPGDVPLCPVKSALNINTPDIFSPFLSTKRECLLATFRGQRFPEMSQSSLMSANDACNAVSLQGGRRVRGIHTLVLRDDSAVKQCSARLSKFR